MPSASTIRLQIESALAHRIPSALTPAAKISRPITPTGITAIDTLLEGGIPIGAITELAGPECSGRTSLALSLMARITHSDRAAAWIDVSDALHPESAAAAGVDLDRLLWVRCGVAPEKKPDDAHYRFVLPEKYMVPPPAIKGLHGGGCGGHPRGETKGLAAAIGGFQHTEVASSSRPTPQPCMSRKQAGSAQVPHPPRRDMSRRVQQDKPWARIEQALRATDLLLQAGGFSAIFLDFGSIAPEHASRVPLATWYRYRAAAERTQTSLIVLTQHVCAKSSAELLLQFQSASAREDECTVFTGMEYRVEVERHRFAAGSVNAASMRKPPQRATIAHWTSYSAWTGAR
jgi:recombination protein RecA